MMPVKLLSVVSPAEITSCSTGAQCMQVLQRFPAAHKGVVLWLLDLMADVADQQEHNKMNERAVAIVMAPNLYDAPVTDDPLDALMQVCHHHPQPPSPLPLPPPHSTPPLPPSPPPSLPLADAEVH